MTEALQVPLAGVIGSPIAHSRSPLLHGYWLRRYGLKGFYIPMDIAQSDLREALTVLPKLGFVGLNVTLPHKETVLGLADIVTDRAALIGAANTLTFRKDGTIFADNTDGSGFIANIRQDAPGWAPASGPAVVFGAGGAARAVVAALIEVGVPEIRIANRTRSRAETLRSDFGAKVYVHDWVQVGNLLGDAVTVVNASALGMTGKPELRVPPDVLNPRTLVTDLVYTPQRTALLEQAEQAGCTVVDGLGMLLHQAAPGFERWFGQRPEIDAATRAAALSL
jgi:shikimate dehydrogenase